MVVHIRVPVAHDPSNRVSFRIVLSSDWKLWVRFLKNCVSCCKCSIFGADFVNCYQNFVVLVYPLLAWSKYNITRMECVTYIGMWKSSYRLNPQTGHSYHAFVGSIYRFKIANDLVEDTCSFTHQARIYSFIVILIWQTYSFPLMLENTPHT